MNIDVFYHTPIYRDGAQVGYCQLVSYDNKEFPFIEYDLDKNYWNKGIMSKELPNFIKCFDELPFRAYCALIKQDNIASKKLIEKNGFIKIATRDDDIEVYLLMPKLAKELNRIRVEVLKLVSKQQIF